MSLTFNQIPPINTFVPNGFQPVYYQIEDGDLMFSDIPDDDDHMVCVWREEHKLHLSRGDISMQVSVPDNDQDIEINLHAFWEMLEEALPRLSKN